MPAPHASHAGPLAASGARTRSTITACLASSQVAGGRPDESSGPSSAASSGDAAEYQALVAQLAPLSPQQLREAAAAAPERLLDSRFLFWLRDLERRRGLGAADREAAARLGQELTAMREWREEKANRTLLPSLASSLAYTNLRRWREESGEEGPMTVGGVDVEKLYRLGEEEERKLRESLERGGGGGGVAPRRGVSRSSIEEFTKHNKAYAELAAGAMARVRSRLMGFDDSGPSAAEAVLRALLTQMGGAEERATFLPDAFTPPGLQIAPDAAGAGGGAAGGKPSFVVTTPDALTAAARARLASLGAPVPTSQPAPNGESQPSSSSPSSSRSPPPPLGRGGAAGAGVAAAGTGVAAAAAGVAAAGAGANGNSTAGGNARLLPSGEDEAAALTELMELIAEYDAQVYSRKTPLERMGHSGMPW